MREYVIPPSIKDESEKVIGGVLTMVQFGWLLLGGVIALGIFLLFAKTSKVFGLILGLFIGGSISLPLAFYKKHGYPILKYLKYKKIYAKKQKKLPNKRIIIQEEGVETEWEM